MELFQPGHLIPLLIVAAVLFFGWKQMPDMARSLGRSLRVFKTEIKGLSEDDKQREEAKAAVAPAIDPPHAVLVKKDVPTSNGTDKNFAGSQGAPASRPRPAPRPGASAAQRPSTGGQ